MLRDMPLGESRTPPTAGEVSRHSLSRVARVPYPRRDLVLNSESLSRKEKEKEKTVTVRVEGYRSFPRLPPIYLFSLLRFSP